jgi:hypothetical protein
MQLFYEKRVNKATQQNLQQTVNDCSEVENGMETNAEN